MTPAAILRYDSAVYHFAALADARYAVVVHERLGHDVMVNAIRSDARHHVACLVALPGTAMVRGMLATTRAVMTRRGGS